MRRLIFGLITHGAALAIGFALGIYFLPILTAPPSPDADTLQATAQEAMFSGALTRDLPGSDALHWGEGTISLTPTQIVHEGRLSPGPDYKLYLLKEFADDEASFEAMKSEALRIGDVKSFNGFILDMPEGVALEEYTTALIWCEAFGEFITATQYR